MRVLFRIDVAQEERNARRGFVDIVTYFQSTAPLPPTLTAAQVIAATRALVRDSDVSCHATSHSPVAG